MVWLERLTLCIWDDNSMYSSAKKVSFALENFVTTISM